MNKQERDILAKMPVRYIPDPDNPGILLQVKPVPRTPSFQLTQIQAGNVANTITANGAFTIVDADSNIAVEFEDHTVRFIVFINGQIELVSRITPDCIPVRLATSQPIPEGKELTSGY